MNIKLGNIIFQQEIINKENIINYYNNIEEKNNNLPTLIIGWKLTKNIFGEENVTILNKKIKDNLFWTFSKEEKQIDYNEDIEKFINQLPEDFIKNIKFEHIDPLIIKLNSLDQLLYYIFKKEDKKINCYVASNNTIYFSKVNSKTEKNNKIFSINLNMIDFLGWDRYLLINEIKNNSQLFITEINKNIEKVFKKIDNYYIYLPYLMDNFSK